MGGECVLFKVILVILGGACINIGQTGNADLLGQ